MKKSQILAALALAFALGVAAPAVSTYAVVIDGNAQVAADATTALNKAIAAGQVAGGYKGDSTVYSMYTNVIDTVKTQNGLLEAAYDSQVADLNAKYLSTFGTALNATTYEAAIAAFEAKNTDLSNAILGNTVSDTDKTTLQGILTTSQGYIATSRSNVAAYKADRAKAIAGAIHNLDTDYNLNNDNFEQVVADAEALPKYNAYKTLQSAIAEGNKVLGSDRYSVAQANAATTAINNAIAAVKGESAPVNSYQVLVSGDVIVSGNFPAGIKLSVKPTSTPIFGNKKVTAYSIEVLNADNSVYKVSENITVSIKLPAGYDAAKSGIYFVEGNQATGYKATFNNGYLSFTTNHLSDWAVVEDTVNNPNTDVNGGNNGGNTGEGADKGGSTAGTPNDGALAKAQGSASSTVSIMAAIATALTAAGAAFIAIRRKLAAKKEA